MTRFTVTWRKSAENQLATLWTNVADRPGITDAANTIDRELATDPETKGYSVSENIRGLHVPPLHVLYCIREADRLVEVLTVKRDPPESNGKAS
jgi:hypothetical protein